MEQISPSEYTNHTLETLAEGPHINIFKKEIPWIENDYEEVPLKKVKIRGAGEFYLGSMIRGKKLIEAAKQLDEHRSQIVDNLFYTVLPDFITHKYHSKVEPIDDAVTDRSIFGTGNKGGQRVYFMRFDDIDTTPVVVRVAACDKARQGDVLSVLTNNKRKYIKHVGKL